MKSAIFKLISTHSLCITSLLLLATACDTPKTQGERLYEAACMNCHGTNGKGLKQLIPPLAGADFLYKQTEALPCIIQNGMKGPVLVNDTRYEHPMPGNEKLSVVEIYNIIHYINNAWGNDAPVPTVKTIDEQLENCRLQQPWSTGK